MPDAVSPPGHAFSSRPTDNIGYPPTPAIRRPPGRVRFGGDGRDCWVTTMGAPRNEDSMRGKAPPQPRDGTGQAAHPQHPTSLVVLLGQDGEPGHRTVAASATRLEATCGPRPLRLPQQIAPNSNTADSTADRRPTALPGPLSCP